jgi:hypothetical protein
MAIRAKNQSLESFNAAVAELRTANEELSRIESGRAHLITSREIEFSRPLAEAKIRVAEAEIAVADNTSSYNRVAGDVNGLRDFEISGLRKFSGILSSVAPPAPVPPLEACDPNSLAEHAAAIAAYPRDVAAYNAKLEDARAEIAAVCAAVAAGDELIRLERQRANLPKPAKVSIPPKPYLGGPEYRVPATIADCEEMIALVEAQRLPTPKSQPSQAENRILLLRLEIEQHEREQREAARRNDARDQWLADNA